jgi:uncharacterized membrane protein YqiK
MTTLEVLVAIVIVIGIFSVTLLVTILSRLNTLEKAVKKNTAILEENKSNMNKVVKLLKILMDRTRKSNPINLN